MCNLCTQSWIPANHRASNHFKPWADSYEWKRIWAIKTGSLADVRRNAKMKDGKPKWADRYNGWAKRRALAETRRERK